ncbi:DUF3299 domain-containing protein [Marinilongibacter aquaticus]|uniref:DUF3299 domain-containing protein n=1 Tax=Marinilongibacter aquaticus TaxID=2975157 RepID=UPI0021BD3731|nr:DUF3299 domain-containing protein [Marinilongibacter aquaticus]UBM59977.1 DUF3299 domain-containing protein [Marinilongibacter aquaticus]
MDKFVQHYFFLPLLVCVVICQHTMGTRHLLHFFSLFFPLTVEQELRLKPTNWPVLDTIASENSPIVQTERLTWQQLEHLRFRLKYNKEFAQMVPYPVFSREIKNLEGLSLQISGYVVPLDLQQGLYALSRFTYASCFFCGGAGEESVISIKFTEKPRRFKTDEFCTIRGTLELNASDLNDFIYIFREAKEVKSR